MQLFTRWATSRNQARGGFKSLLASDVFSNFLGVAKRFLNLAFHLFLQTLGLLLFIANQLAGLFLNFASDVFAYALDLIFVHARFSNWLKIFFICRIPEPENPAEVTTQ
jgi:hypothetical protein